MLQIRLLMRTLVETDRFATLLLAALGFAPACGGAVATTSDGGGDGTGGSTAGAGGSTAGAGGSSAGVGGSTAGVGGSTAGVGGSTAGVGGSTAGVGGSTAGTGGSMAGAGGSTAGAGGSTAGAGGSVNVNPYPCVDANDLGGGYATCQNGITHRALKATCRSLVPRPAPIAPVPDGGADAAASPGACRSDSDCTAKPHGYCASPGPGYPPNSPHYCNYGCVQDSECDAKSICVCGDPVGQCVSAACTVDSECGAGLVCGSTVLYSGCPMISYACQTVLDQCASDVECSAETHCSVVQGHRTCAPRACVIGRPFLIEGVARLAERGGAAAWREMDSAVAAISASLSVRARLAEEWTQIALMEHASIAAFARFTLQLLSLGAPADLVQRSNAAALDETRHAQIAFAVASAYAGAEVGPGVLDLSGAFTVTSLADIVRNVVREGCVGETIAAVEAAEAAKHAVDPTTRSALQGIANDELAHAELAWRFVRWALATGGSDLRDIVCDELRAVEHVSPPSRAGSSPAEEEHMLAGGVVVGERREQVRRAAMSAVVLPCGRALLGEAKPWRTAQSSRLTT